MSRASHDGKGRGVPSGVLAMYSMAMECNVSSKNTGSPFSPSGHSCRSGLRLTLSDARDRIGLLIRDLDGELFLNRHHHLDGVQAVESKVLGEGRLRR